MAWGHQPCHIEHNTDIMKYVIIQVLLVLALVLVVFGVIILIWTMTRKRNGLKYEEILRDDFHIPIENGTLAGTLNVYAAKRAIKKLRMAKADYMAASMDEKCKRKFFDMRLKFFHLFSFLGCDDEVIRKLVEMARKVGKTLSYNELRVDPEEAEIINGTKVVSEQNCEAALDHFACLRSRVKSIFDKATVISNKKTKNFWGNESGWKNRNVRDDLLDILKALKKETTVINQMLAGVERIISAVRLSFFRNQYLCSELMEYCQVDSVEMKIFPDIHLLRSKPVVLRQYEDDEDHNNVEIQISEFKISFHYRQSKDGKEEIEALKGEAKDILKAIEETVDDLRKRYDTVVWTIDITRSLIAVNKKFVLQYIPLRRKVFVNGAKATSQELQTLAQTVSQRVI